MKINFNVEKLEKLFKAFYTLTGIRIVLFDNEFKEVFSYPSYDCSFCKKIKSNEIGNRLCKESDKKGFIQCQNSLLLYTYHCHAGLIESMIHLRQDDNIIGYIMFGQISDVKNKDSRIKELNEEFKKITGIELEENIDDIRYKSKDQIEAASLILLTLAKYTVNENLIKENKDDFKEKIDDIINENIDNSNLSINDFVKELNICKTVLYEKCKKILNINLFKYIKNKRINKAKELLENSSLPVSKICFDVGFTDYNYFSKVFKQETGYTCSEYRKKFE